MKFCGYIIVYINPTDILITVSILARIFAKIFVEKPKIVTRQIAVTLFYIRLRLNVVFFLTYE